jgi:hypothetical protein
MGNEDIMLFELPFIERQWTKGISFQIMQCNSDEYRDSNQILASFILIRRTNKSELFFTEYLRYCEDARLITDEASSISEDPSFLDHRHDQSILSLLAKKNGIEPHRDPSQFGVSPKIYKLVLDNYCYYRENGVSGLYNAHEFLSDTYPQIIRHTRKEGSFVWKLKQLVPRAVKKRIKNLISNKAR